MGISFFEMDGIESQTLFRFGNFENYDNDNDNDNDNNNYKSFVLIRATDDTNGGHFTIPVLKETWTSVKLINEFIKSKCAIVNNINYLNLRVVEYLESQGIINTNNICLSSRRNSK